MFHAARESSQFGHGVSLFSSAEMREFPAGSSGRHGQQRGARKSCTPTNSDSEEETGAKLVEMYVPKRWGDDEEDNSAW